MPTRSVEIGSSVGLHARPAALFVQAVNDAGVPVTICKPGGKPAPANSMLPSWRWAPSTATPSSSVATPRAPTTVLDGLVALLERDLDAEK